MINSFKHRRLVTLLAVSATVAMVGSTAPRHAVALDDDYLKMLEQESNDVVPETRETATGSSTSGTIAPSAEERPARTQQGFSSPFEQELHRDYPGSYLLYSRLNPDQQRRLQQKYQSSRSFSDITRMILDLYSEE